MTNSKEPMTEIEILKSRLERLEKEQNYANKVVQENNHLRDELYLVYTSWSWRLTWPLRKIAQLYRKLKG